MTKMTRRGFLARSTAVTALSLTPIPKAMAMVSHQTANLRWFGSGTDEFAYPFLAESAEGAARQFACEFGHTVGEECPECSESGCYEHNDDLDAPQPWIAENTFGFPDTLPIDHEPTMADWVRAGCNVICEICNYEDPVDCRIFEGKAHCDDCRYEARRRRLDRLVGTIEGTPFRQRLDLW